MQVNAMSGWQAFILTLVFIVTGYIAHSVASRFTPRRSERIELQLLRFLTYGSFNTLVSIPVVLSHTKLTPNATWMTFITENVTTYYLLTIYVLFIIPVIIGICAGLINLMYGMHEWYRGYATWEEKLSRTRDQWVLITLDSGNTVLGFFGKDSFVFTESTEKDLFLGKVYEKNPTGEWQKVPRTRGMLIRGSTIQSIEFWSGRPEETIEEKNLFARLLAQFKANQKNCIPPNRESSLINTSSSLEDVPEENTDEQVEKVIIWPKTSLNGSTSSSSPEIEVLSRK